MSKKRWVKGRSIMKHQRNIFLWTPPLTHPGVWPRQSINKRIILDKFGMALQRSQLFDWKPKIQPPAPSPIWSTSPRLPGRFESFGSAPRTSPCSNTCARWKVLLYLTEVSLTRDRSCGWRNNEMHQNHRRGCEKKEILVVWMTAALDPGSDIGTRLTTSAGGRKSVLFI